MKTAALKKMKKWHAGKRSAFTEESDQFISKTLGEGAEYTWRILLLTLEEGIKIHED